ncbi:hypothetical protein Tco_0736698 [Tanacetum coccineum]
MVSLILGLGGLESSEFVHDPQSSSLAVTSSGLSSDVSDAGLPSEKGSRLALAQVIGLPKRLVSQFFLEWNVLWRLPVLGSCLACLHRLPIMSLLFAFPDKVTFVNYWCVQAACAFCPIVRQRLQSVHSLLVCIDTSHGATQRQGLARSGHEPMSKRCSSLTTS